MHAVLIEHDGIGRDDHRWCLARDEQFNRAIDSRIERAVRIGDVDSVSSVRLPGCNAVAIRVTLPGKPRSGISGTRTTASTPGPSPKAWSWGTNTWVRITSGCISVNMKSTGCHQTAVVDVALCDHTVEWRHHALVGLLLLSIRIWASWAAIFDCATPTAACCACRVRRSLSPC